MNKEKQIEEMALIISGSNELDTMNYYKARIKAKDLYNANCRILDEGSIVLTEEQFSEFRQTIINLSQEHTKKCDEMNDKIINARKQAIGEFAERLKNKASSYSFGDKIKIHNALFVEDIDEVAKEFGVEV